MGVDERLTYRESGNCRIIDFDAPGRESMDVEELCDRIAWDEEARVVLLIFGRDINDILKKSLETGRNSLIEAIAKMKQPVIAAMRGDAVGPALELALACDLRIGTRSARFGFPEIQEGNVPSNGGTQRLPRLVGRGKALYMILTGELIDAAEACRIGLINRVVSPDALIDAASEMAQDMAAKSPLSLSYVKEALYRGSDLTLDQGIGMELDMYLLLFSTSDRTEGITSFRDKRKPVFRGD
jgi:enoyl-CoA hydratase/carnithine racemase